MWRTIFAVVLLPSLTAAQADFSPREPDLKRPLADSSSTSPKAVAYLSLSELRQGTQEKVAVTFDRPIGFVTSPRSPVPGLVPVSLELEPAEGLTVGPIDYPKAFDYRFKFQTQPVAVFQFPWQQIEFKLGAMRNAAPGKRLLTGRLTFQTVSDAGVSEVRQIDVEIPVTVVEHNARVSRVHSFPAQASRPLNPALIVLMIVLAPIAIPLWILACTVGGQDCRC
jgi:hypothetical protein